MAQQSTALTVAGDTDWSVIEKVVIGNDLKQLSDQQRVVYYRQLCESLHLNALTRPFQYMTLQGKLTLYATKDAAEQLRNRNGVSITRLDEKSVNDIYVVTAYARTPEGREDIDMGAVNIAGKRGDDLVNAMLKAATKAKRRVTLSICGLGMIDETEVETIAGAHTVEVDEHGAIVEPVRALPSPRQQPQRQPAPSSLPVTRTRATVQPNGVEQRKRQIIAAAAEKGVTLTLEMSSLDWADAINDALDDAGVSFRVTKDSNDTITPRAIESGIYALPALPPREVDQETGEVREEADEPEMSEDDRALYDAVDQGRLMPVDGGR